MSEIIQGFGFMVQPLGQIPYLGADANTPSWITDNEWYSARVTIKATGEVQTLQVVTFFWQTIPNAQDIANQQALAYGNRRAGNW
jgi:hypothetical protein